MKKNHPFIFLFLLLLVLMGSGCLNDSYDPPIVNACDTTYYQRIIRPIITTNCSISGCHDGSNSTANYNLYEELKKSVEKEEDGVPELLYYIKLPVNDPEHMPKDAELAPEDIAAIELWIAQGYGGCDL